MASCLLLGNTICFDFVSEYFPTVCLFDCVLIALNVIEAFAIKIYLTLNLENLHISILFKLFVLIFPENKA